MPLGDYLVGVAYFLPTITALAVAAWLVTRTRYSHLAGAQLVLAYALLLTAGLIAVHVLPLAFGVLSRATVLLCALLCAGAAWWLSAPTPRRPGAAPAVPPSGLAAIVIALVGVGAAAVYQLGRVEFLSPLAVTDIDVLNFHLPGVARWIQSGSLWQIDQLFPYFVTGNYPNNGDVVTLAAVLPWREVAFARLVPVPFVALTGLAVYALACELRAPRATAAVFAAAAVMVPALYAYAFEGLPDAIMLFAFVTGMLFLLRHARTGLPSDLVIAGLGLGVAFGTKWYGVTSVVAVLVVWAAVALLARRPPPRVIREGAALLAMIAAAGGIWLVRNLVESGNPIYPQRIDAFGVTLLPGPDGLILDRVGYTVAGYLDDWEVLGDVILPGFARQLGLMGALCLVGVVAAVVLAARGARRRPRDPVDVATLALAAVVVLICALYAITPGSAFGEEGEPVQAFTTVRWLVPAPLLAAALAAAAAARLGRARIVFELAALAAVADGIRRGVGVPLGSALPVAFALALLAGAGWAVYRHRERLAEPIRRRRLAIGVAVAAAVTVAAVGAGRFQQQRFAEEGYTPFDPTLAWLEQNAPAGRRVGLAGIWDVNGVSPVFPSFGPRLRNDVVYVGPWIEELLREYDRRRPFVEALRRGGYDLLLVGRGQPPRPSVAEERWAMSAGYRRVAESPRLALYAAPAQAAQKRGGSLQANLPASA